MRYPVGNGTKEDFIKNWYVAEGFGSYRSVGNYYHSGSDINLRTGGNTDSGQPINAISSGRITYYHKASHPTSSYGLHNVYQISGAWGVRWVHQAHCMDKDFIAAIADVSEGSMVGRIGNTGNSVSAHLHFSVFRVDPATLPNGIDTIAKTPTQLDTWWEDPIAFINKYIGGSMPGDEWGDTVYKSTQFDEVCKSIWGNDVNPRQKSANDVMNHINSLENRIKELEQQSGGNIPQVPSGWIPNGYQTTVYSDGKSSISTNYKKE